MTAQELIDELKRFHPSDEIEISIPYGIEELVPDADGEMPDAPPILIDSVEHNNGERRRILIIAHEAQ